MGNLSFTTQFNHFLIFDFSRGQTLPPLPSDFLLHQLVFTCEEMPSRRAATSTLLLWRSCRTAAAVRRDARFFTAFLDGAADQDVRVRFSTPTLCDSVETLDLCAQ